MAVLVIHDHGHRREAVRLSTTHETVIGGRAHDIDLGYEHPVGRIIPASGTWRFERLAETPEVLVVGDGDTMRIDFHMLQLFLVDDVALALDAQRYVASVVDLQTGLWNRRFLATHAARIRRPAPLLYIDIDRMKIVNDRYGFTGGHLVLCGTAARFQAHVRWPEIAARWGGEELLAILPDSTREHAIERAEQIRRACEVPFDFEGEQLFGRVSIGVTVLTGDDLVAGIRAAEEQMHNAKRQGRNRVVSG